MTKVLNMNNKVEESNSPIKEIQKLEKIKESKKESTPVFVIEFSWKLIALVVGILSFIFFGKQILNVLVFLFLSIVVMSVALPVVNWFERRKFSKGLSIGIAYTLGVVLLLGVISVVIIPFVNQIDNLIESVPVWVESFTSNIKAINIGEFTLDSKVINETIIGWFEKLASFDSFENIANTLGGVFGWVSIAVAAVIFSIYMVIDHDNIVDFGLIRIASDEKRARVKKLVFDVEGKLGKWLLGQATVSTIAGTVLGLVLALFGIPFALPMGVFIALLSAIPSVGATVASIPPLLIALISNGPLAAFILLIIFLVYQQIENNFIIPKVMGSAAGVSPMMVLFSAITFLILFGVWGAVLAVPAIVIARICYEFYIDLQKMEAKGSIN